MNAPASGSASAPAGAAGARRARTPASAIGDKIRTFAAVYAASGQRERVEGLMQAALTVDAELAGHAGIVDHPALLVLMAAIEALSRETSRLSRAVEQLEKKGKGRPPGAAAAGAAIAPLLGAVFGPVHSEAPIFKADQVAMESLGKAGRALELRALEGVPAAGERAVLEAIGRYPGGLTPEHLTIVADYKRTTRDLYVRRLVAAQLVERQGKRLHATRAGLAELGKGFRRLPAKGAALCARMLAELSGGEHRILELLTGGGHTRALPMTRDQIGELTDYKRTTRDLYVRRLVTRELVEDAGGGRVVAAARLF